MVVAEEAHIGSCSEEVRSLDYTIGEVAEAEHIAGRTLHSAAGSCPEVVRCSNRPPVRATSWGSEISEIDQQTREDARVLGLVSFSRGLMDDDEDYAMKS